MFALDHECQAVYILSSPFDGYKVVVLEHFVDLELVDFVDTVSAGCLATAFVLDSEVRLVVVQVLGFGI